MALSDEDAHGTMPSARRDRSVVVDGWFASHADSGTPGPHLRLRASDFEDLVIRTDQVPMLCALLTAVAERIDARWAVDGERYADEVVRRAPDPQDPEVERAAALARLRFVADVGARAEEVLALVRAADSTDEAVDAVAALLDADPADVLVRLARFNLLGLTRAATERRWQLIDGD
ncbi:hypothetical protein [Nocardioides nitrophenolicus]|uniref:hypothetical protein n=1 Tax=Nocardioides nitrophenolicus TaxID=60489 RepID=UPI001956CD22|nr:hypothetical protein [Nocardioides nitrophenolicus]MBM7520120.1 hypothetical protein [Nocardioides nitrophenolicus]